MGGNHSRQPSIQNPGQYHEHFREVSKECKVGPVQQRSCNDTCCLVLFIVLTLIMIIGGSIFIANSKFWDPDHVMNTLSKIGNQTATASTRSHMKNQDQFDFHAVDFGKILGVVIGMTIFSIVLSIIFLCLMSRFPKCMVYSMLGISGVLLLAVIVIGIVVQQYLFSLMGLIFLGIMGCFLWCYRDQIRIGIVLLKVTGDFLREKPSVFLAPIFVSMIGFPLFFFLIASLIAIQLNFPEEDQKVQRDVLSGVWLFLSTFYGFFIYYVMVFLIAVATGLWYYSVDKNYLFTALGWIFKSHIGSFTFASILVAIISSARQAAQSGSQNNQGNVCVTCCLCFIACFFRFIEQLLKVLNHNAIIVMSITGQSYIESAKSTISLILGNFGLFLVVDVIGSLVSFCIGIVVIVLPAVIGFFLLKAMIEDPSDAGPIIGVIGILFLCAIAANLFLSVLTQSLSCVFVFYCLDKRFSQLGYPVVNQVPAPMKGLLMEMQQESSYQMAQQNDNNFHQNQQRNYSNNNNQNNQWNNNQRW